MKNIDVEIIKYHMNEDVYKQALIVKNNIDIINNIENVRIYLRKKGYMGRYCKVTNTESLYNKFLSVTILKNKILISVRC